MASFGRFRQTTPAMRLPFLHAADSAITSDSRRRTRTLADVLTTRRLAEFLPPRKRRGKQCKDSLPTPFLPRGNQRLGVLHTAAVAPSEGLGLKPIQAAFHS